MSFNLNSKNLAGPIFHSLINCGLPFGNELFTRITDTLLMECFSPPVSILSDKIVKALPEMIKKLKDNSLSVKTLKIAEDSAKLIGFYEIHTLKRDDERRLVFEAALVVIFLIGNQRGDFGYPKLELYDNQDEFLNVYRDIRDFTLKDLDKFETYKLLYFTNFMKAVLRLVPNPKGKRAHLVDLVTRISERRDKKYITGTGQSCATQRRVAVYQNESGVAPVPRPPRMKEIAGLILDDSISAAHVSEDIANLINENNTNKQVEVYSYSFPHPSEENVKVDATELVSQKGQSLMRALSVSRYASDTGLPSYEILRSFSMAALLNSNGNDYLKADMEFMKTIEDLELELPEGLSLSRQTMREQEGVVRGISVSRQISTNELDSSLFQSDMNISDLMRGGSLIRFETGESGLLRSISRSLSLQINSTRTLPFDPFKTNSMGLTRQLSSAFDSNFSAFPIRSSSINISRGISEVMIRSLTSASFLDTPIDEEPEDTNSVENDVERPRKMPRQEFVWDALLELKSSNVSSNEIN